MNEQKHDDACGASRSGAGLAVCPCGKIPTTLQIYDAGQGGKWANVAGDCCGEWLIEFRTNYTAQDSDECKALAALAWNSAPRAAAAVGRIRSPAAGEDVKEALMMTLCVIDGGHCTCRPDEGVPCVAAEALKSDNARMRAALEQLLDNMNDGHCVCQAVKQKAKGALVPIPLDR